MVSLVAAMLIPTLLIGKNIDCLQTINVAGDIELVLISLMDYDINNINIDNIDIDNINIDNIVIDNIDIDQYNIDNIDIETISYCKDSLIRVFGYPWLMYHATKE